MRFSKSERIQRECGALVSTAKEQKKEERHNSAQKMKFSIKDYCAWG